MQTERRVAANPQTKPTDLGRKSTCRLLLSPFTITIYYYYSAWMVILILQGGMLSWPRHCSKAVYYLWGELGPHLRQCRQGWGLPLYQLASWSILPFGHNRHEPKSGGKLLCPFPWGGRAGSPFNTMSPEPRPTSAPSGILIHTAIWPQQTWAVVYTDACL